MLKTNEVMQLQYVKNEIVKEMKGQLFCVLKLKQSLRVVYLNTTTVRGKIEVRKLYFQYFLHSRILVLF